MLESDFIGICCLVESPNGNGLRPVGIGGSLTLSGNGLAVTVTVQHRLSPRAMSMLANVSQMYAECFDKVLYHVNLRILKCKMTNVITMTSTTQRSFPFATQA